MKSANDRILTSILTALLLFTSPLFASEKKGGLVLQFDDGWTSWATGIAPELKQVGGMATGFVNNQNLRNGRITTDDLLTLQNVFGWEIGTHAWHHMNAPVFVRKYGIDRWLSEELTRAMSELSAAGLTVRSLVFPFNAFDKNLVAAIFPIIETYRRTDPLALAVGASADRSVPGTAIDMAHYVPVELLKQWLDMAAEQDQLLFLYGHRILPDSCFATGTVVSVTSTTLTAALDITLPAGTDLLLVPDSNRRSKADTFTINRVSGKMIEVNRPDLTANTQPGAPFLIGEAYSMRLSDFRSMIKHASTRVNFYTLHDVATGKQLGGSTNSPTGP
jgi:hypothetical protein